MPNDAAKLGRGINQLVDKGAIYLIDKFTSSGDCISPGGNISEELSLCIQEVRLNLWQWTDVKLSTKDRAYSAVGHSGLL